MTANNIFLIINFIVSKVTVDAGLEANPFPQSEVLAKVLAARLKGFYKKKTIPPKVARRVKRGPVFFKCVRVDYDKATGKLNLGEEEVVGLSTHRGEEEDKDYKETMVGSEIEQSDCAGKLSYQLLTGEQRDQVVRGLDCNSVVPGSRPQLYFDTQLVDYQLEVDKGKLTAVANLKS